MLNRGGAGGYERFVINWLSWASVAGQSDTSAVGFTQFAGCQVKLIVLPSAGHSLFSSGSGRGKKKRSLSSLAKSNSPPSSDHVFESASPAVTVRRLFTRIC